MEDAAKQKQRKQLMALGGIVVVGALLFLLLPKGKAVPPPKEPEKPEAGETKTARKAPVEEPIVPPQRDPFVRPATIVLSKAQIEAEEARKTAEEQAAKEAEARAAMAPTLIGELPPPGGVAAAAVGAPVFPTIPIYEMPTGPTGPGITAINSGAFPGNNPGGSGPSGQPMMAERLISPAQGISLKGTVRARDGSRGVAIIDAKSGEASSTHYVRQGQTIGSGVGKRTVSEIGGGTITVKDPYGGRARVGLETGSKGK